jgi:hypothetical protein
MYIKKKVKIIEKIGNITYLESDDTENKKKRTLSVERKKQMSEKRRKRKVQPRTGQSKKCQNFFSQLFKDYIKQTSAVGKYMRGKSANMHSNDNYDPTDLNNNDNVFDIDDYIENELKEEDDETTVVSYNTKQIGYDEKYIKPIKLTSKHKKEISRWLKKKEKLLKSITADKGVLNEYDVQKLLFNEFKMTEELIQNIEENSKNHIKYDDIYIDILDNQLFSHYNNEDIIFDSQSSLIPSIIDNKLYSLLYSEDKEDEYDIIRNNFVDKYQNIIGYYENERINPKYLESYCDIIAYSILLLNYNKKQFNLIKKYIESYYFELSTIITPNILKGILNGKDT